MKPHTYLRKAKGYCCRWCDGPYKTFKNKNRRALKKRDRTIAKKEIAKASSE